MTRYSVLTAVCSVAVGLAVAADAAPQETAPPVLRAVSRTVYTPATELFAEFRPLIVGEQTRLTAHLTRVGERFRPYMEGAIKLTYACASRSRVWTGPPMGLLRTEA